MKYITTKSELMLHDSITAIRDNRDGWRLVHLAFSQNPQVDPTSITPRVNQLREALHDTEATLFHGSDHDLWLLFSGATSSLVRAFGCPTGMLLLEALSEFLTLAPAEQSTTKLYDLSRTEHYDHVSTLAKSRVPVEAEKPKIIAEEAKIEAVFNQSVFANNTAKRAGRDTPTILVVEDEPFTRKLVTTFLRKSYTVIEAANGAEALQKYAFEAPDIVFLDIEMPDIKGPEVLAKIIPSDPDAYIVMLSGNRAKETVLQTVQTGAKGYVAKPFPKDRIQHYINDWQANR